MTRFLGVVLVAFALTFASMAEAGTFNQDPNASRLTFKLSGLPTISIPHEGTGTASLTGGTSPYLVVNGGIWSTSGFGPGTALFTGVPLISNLIIGVFCNKAKVVAAECPASLSGQTTGAAINPAVNASKSIAVPNPVGPGSLASGLVGYGGFVTGSAKVVAGNGLGFTLNLANLGATNAVQTELKLTGLATIQVTFGPWVTANVPMTNITTNVVQLPNRPGTPVGIPFTLDPLTTEEVKTYMASDWATASGVHPTNPPVVFVTTWKDSFTPGQSFQGTTVNGAHTTINGTHAPGVQVPVDLIKQINAVTLTKGGIDPTSLTSQTGTVTLITPLRIDTSDQLVNSIPAVMRMKFSFVPEPGTLLLLLSGTVGLVLVGRSRARKH